MNKPSSIAHNLFAQRHRSIDFEKLAEGDLTEWITLILALAIFVAIAYFIVSRADRWSTFRAIYSSVSTASLLGALLGIVIPVLLVNYLGIAEYLLLVVLGAYLGAVVASRPNPKSASSHAALVATLIALWMAHRAYYVAVDRPAPGQIFAPWFFFVPAVFVVTGLLAMPGGAILFGALASRQPNRDARDTRKNEPLAQSVDSPLATSQILRVGLVSLILIVSAGALVWQVNRYASEHRILRGLNEDFWNTASRRDQIGIRVRWSQAKPSDSWWFELLRIRLGGSRLPRITRLIGNKQADDESLQALQVLPNLSELDLSQASITDAGLVHLQRFPNLKRLSLGLSSVTDEAIAALQRQADPPGVVIRRIKTSQASARSPNH
jgi:hypothetical protein